jgi:FtsP/CotA-like multicopper oxidase with cupredoxin domain
MDLDTTRRDFLKGGSLATAGLLASVPVSSAAGSEQDQPKGDDKSQPPKHEHQHEHGQAMDYPRDRPGFGGPVGSPTDRGKLVPGRRATDLPPVSVETPDLFKLPWKMAGGFKEFHLVAKHTRREFLPSAWMDVWGYNDSMPGPTIEVNQGDRVRIVLHNELPESTTLHLHGIELPNRFDGVPGVVQDPIKPGKSYVYEFDALQAYSSSNVDSHTATSLDANSHAPSSSVPRCDSV